MADPPRAPKATPPARPIWVKVFGFITAVIVLVVVVQMVFGGGQHGPGRHMPGGGVPAEHSPPTEREP
ncbi:MAG: hypothetical protein H0W55_08430 [Actinobacteria bacterium]|nr:hypothetical protein [Actinomycetota bacterium]MDQ3530918.1 hypothetical protein [Actinomycetota bacterium]